MGNLPVMSKRSAVQFGEYSEVTKGKFSLRSFPPYDMSCEDLRPMMMLREGRGRSWVEEDGTGAGDSATILGLEMDQESDDIYSGVIKFHYSDGLENFCENLTVQTTTTVSELLPELITHFLPHEYQLDAVDGTQPSSVALVQGQRERELEVDEKPLEIALDCSAKGLASPKFLFKSSLPPSAPPLTPRRGSGYATNLLGAVDCTLHLSQPDHYNSTMSLGSGLSIASSKSAKSKSSSSLTGKNGGKKKVQQTLSNQEGGGASPSVPSKVQNTPTPTSGRKMSRSKAAVSNFITRSLRVRRKSKQSVPPESPSAPTFHLQDDREEEEEEEEEQEDEVEVGEDYDSMQLTNSLVSPRLPVEKKFTLSTVMHIYFTEGKQAQVYKSVLVSEKATTVEVIAQALERYNMKCRNPHEYTLFDVIGRWQDVTNTIRSQFGYPTMLGLQHNKTLPNMNILNASPLIQRRASVEEFTVCYCRELGPDESPYNTQFYLTAQEGFNRRFELRSKSSPSPMSRSMVSHEKSHSVDIMERPDEVTPTPGDVTGERKKVSEEQDDFSGIFGNTAHRKRAKRNRIGNQSVDSADPDTQVTILSDNTPPPPTLPPRGVALDKEEKEGEGSSWGLTHAAHGNTGITVRENRARTHGSKHDTEIPISLNKSHAPDFSALCSSPDSGVEFNKQANSTKSSVSSEQSEQSASGGDPVGIYPANLECPFLLSLRLQDPSREHLVHKLTSDTTELGSWSSSASSSSQECPAAADDSLTERIPLRCPDLVGSLCCFCRQPIAESPMSSRTPEVLQFSHALQRTNPDVHISLNGDEITHTASLRHGDIITIAGTYFFMFVDYTSQPAGSPSHFDWKLLSHRSGSQRQGVMTASMETITEQDSSRKACSLGDAEREGVSMGNLSGGSSSGQEESEGWETSSNHGRRVQTLVPSSKGKELDDSPAGDYLEASSLRRPSNGGGGSGNESTNKMVPMSSRSKRSPKHKKASENSKTKSHHQTLNKTQSLPLPQDRKLIFSFQASEEDALLSHVVSARATGGDSLCKLAPAYILAMCTEYSMMSGSPKQVVRFIQKATDRIQEVVWEFTRKLTSWDPPPQMPQKPLQLKKELFPLLEPVFLWLANALEFYHFLVAHRGSLHLPGGAGDRTPQGCRKEGEDNPISTLYSVLVYAYQQAFYPVSKVLYQSLPLMLESCVEENLYDGNGHRAIVIGEAVQFLQALLDLITEQHLHLEVVSQFYANLFFFINAAMFNALLERGGDLGLYQEYSGTVLRENLNLLEGWACQVGFKDSVLHYLAKFSGAIDLLATPTDKLLKLNWSNLRGEFPVLHSAQLHYLLSQYLLPTHTQVPAHWTPSKEDARHALTGKSLEESFNNHPGFRLPSSNFSLDLSHPPPEPELFQDILDELRSDLQQHETSNGVQDTKVTVFNGGVASSVSGRVRVGRNAGGTVISNGYSERSEGNIGSHTESEEDLLSVSTHNNHKNLEKNFNYSQSSDRSIMESFQYQNGTAAEISSREKVGRVRTVVSAQSFATPEKLILEEPAGAVVSRVHPVGGSAEAPPTGSSWMGKFPRGSKTVTVPRGDKGFGFIIVEKKDPTSKESLIVVQQIIPGSPASHCHQLKPGDQILAVDEQLLDGADYLIADKYVKEAEDDVTLILAPRTLTL